MLMIEGSESGRLVGQGIGSDRGADMTIADSPAREASGFFEPIPSWRAAPPEVRVVTDVPAGATVVGIPVASDGDVPERVGFDRATLDASDFSGGIGETLALPQVDGPLVIESGLGPR